MIRQHHTQSHLQVDSAEILPDTTAWSIAERQETVLWSFLDVRGRETFRVEFLRILVDPRIMVDRVHGNHNSGTRRD